MQPGTGNSYQIIPIRSEDGGGHRLRLLKGGSEVSESGRVYRTKEEAEKDGLRWVRSMDIRSR